MTGMGSFGGTINYRQDSRLEAGRMAWVMALAFTALACGQAVGPAGTAQTAPEDTASAPEGTTETTPEVIAEKRQYTVGVDGSTDEFTGSFHRFFPDRLTVHAGDTIVFRRPDNGEPHTVTLGTGAPTIDSPPGSNFFEGGFGGAPRKERGMPCFLSDGLPPDEGCAPAQQEPVPFDGTQSWFSSGGLLGEEEFRLELADDTAPGTYTFVCLLHTFVMKGTMEVAGPGEPADEPADVTARGAQQLEQQVALIQSRVERPATPGENEVTASMADEDLAAWANIFNPDEMEIPVGGTVTWSIRHFHTISFNAPESARPFYERAQDGSVQENQQGATPSGDPDGWDGSGFLNSGFRAGMFPPDQFSVTFTNPGTYPYRCLIHFDMEGSVNVVDE